jgi:lysophospholipase L1-like esterase
MKTLLILALTANALNAQSPAIHREGTEWTDVWLPNTNAHDLPRVLLIGDSITRAYFTAVESNLKGKAYVARIATSKAVGDPALLTELAAFLPEARFDVIHFNVGMHGWDYTEDDYRKYFPDMVAAIRKYAPGAKLVWATTTPVRKDREKGATNARIEVRNAIVKELAAAQRIPVDDLHAAIAAHVEMHSDDIHFNKEGSALLADQVAAEISKLLPAK